MGSGGWTGGIGSRGWTGAGCMGSGGWTGGIGWNGLTWAPMSGVYRMSTAANARLAIHVERWHLKAVDEVMSFFPTRVHFNQYKPVVSKPRARAARNPSIKPAKEDHMHALSITFDGKDKIVRHGTRAAPGKKPEIMEIAFTRVQCQKRGLAALSFPFSGLHIRKSACPSFLFGFKNPPPYFKIRGLIFRGFWRILRMTQKGK